MSESEPPIHWRAHLIVSIDCVGPTTTDDVARFAAESVHHGAISLADAECRIATVSEDDEEHGTFYRTTAFLDALQAMDEGQW